jgi:hypothetical protein
MESDFKVSIRANFGEQVNQGPAMNDFAHHLPGPRPAELDLTLTIGTARRDLPTERAWWRRNANLARPALFREIRHDEARRMVL